MSRAITAIYRSHATATLVREELEQFGIGRHQVTIVPDTDVSGLSDRTDDNLRGAFGQLHALDLPEEDTRTYQQALRNGDHVVSVRVDGDDDLSRIQEIMRRPEDAYDLDALDTEYSAAEYVPPYQAGGTQMAADMGTRGAFGTQQGGYATTGSMSQTGGMGTGYTGEREFGAEDTVEVVEEELSVGKREVERGAVRVRSYMREVPVDQDVSLRSTRVYVERHPVDRAVTAGDTAFRDHVLEASEHEEQAVVAKQARVVEEIGLRQETETRQEHIHDTVRKTEVEIEDTRTGESTNLTGGTSTDRDRY